MKLNYLFPHRFKRLALIVFVPSLLFGIYALAFNVEPEFLDCTVWSIFSKGLPFSENKDIFLTLTQTNLLDEILAIIIVTSGLVLSFAKEKEEDEMIQKIRLDSLVWATYLNFAIFLIAILFVYDMAFLWVLIFNPFVIIIFFAIRFNWQVRKLKNSLVYEE